MWVLHDSWIYARTSRNSNEMLIFPTDLWHFQINNQVIRDNRCTNNLMQKMISITPYIFKISHFSKELLRHLNHFKGITTRGPVHLGLFCLSVWSEVLDLIYVSFFKWKAGVNTSSYRTELKSGFSLIL